MKKILTLLLSFWTYISISQTVDPTFNASYDGSYQQNIGDQSALLPSGKFLSVYKNDPANYMISQMVSVKRIETNGKIDPTFTCDIGTGHNNYNIYTLSNGGFFFVSLLNDEVFMKKYTSTGAIDNSFTAPVFSQRSSASYTSYYEIKSFIIQPDGKIIVAGNFTKVNAIATGAIVRLNADGTLDSTFQSGTGLGGAVNCVFRQNDGKYMVCGNISNYNGVARRHILRLNSDGTLDTGFNVPYNTNTGGLTANGFESPLNAVAVQSDGKIIPVGNSFYVNSNRIDGIIRLNVDGTRDTSFQSLTNVSSIYYYYLTILADGKILIKNQTSGIMKLNSNGTIDTGFASSGSNVSNPLTGGFYMAGNQIIVNSHKMTGGVTRAGFHRLNADGSLDKTFNPSFGFNTESYYILYGGPGVSPIPQVRKVLPDGKVWFQGDFSSYNDIGFTKKVCRLTFDGNYDPTFNLDPSLIGNITGTGRIKVTQDGKLLCLNSYTVPATPSYYSNLVRLNYDGSLDNTFTYRSDNYAISNFFPLRNGKIIVTGTASMFVSNGKYKLLCLNNDGTIDNSFVCPLLATDLSKYTFEEQPDGKILVCGENSSLALPNYLKRINPDGSLDTSLALPTNFYAPVYRTKLQPDGKILLSYLVNNFNYPYLKIGRFNSDGTIDSSFTVVTDGLSSATGQKNYTPIAVMSNGEIYLSAYRPSNYFNTTSLTNSSVIVLNPNGTFNRSFGNRTGTFDMQDCSKIIFSSTDDLTFETSLRKDLVRYSIDTSNGVNPPSGSLSQNFTIGQTLADLVVVGQNIQWYTTQSECMSFSTGKNNNEMQSLLPSSTPLVNGTTYYASQTVNGIESQFRLPVTATQALGINDSIFSNLKVYPNPTLNSITLPNIDPAERIELYSLLGQRLFSKEVNSETELTIELGSFETGVYSLKVSSGTVNRIIKIVKN